MAEHETVAGLPGMAIVSVLTHNLDTTSMLISSKRMPRQHYHRQWERNSPRCCLDSATGLFVINVHSVFRIVIVVAIGLCKLSELALAYSFFFHYLIMSGPAPSTRQLSDPALPDQLPSLPTISEMFPGLMDEVRAMAAERREIPSELISTFEHY